jgi:hypothetical protein
MDGATIVAILSAVAAVLKALAMLVQAVRSRRAAKQCAHQLESAGV